MDVGSAKQHIITMLTQDSPDKVMAFYEAKAKAGNLPVKHMNSPTGPALSVGPIGPLGMADTMITAMPTATGTSVNVAVMAK
jgi:hypothetical protein